MQGDSAGEKYVSVGISPRGAHVVCKFLSGMGGGGGWVGHSNDFDSLQDNSVMFLSVLEYQIKMMIMIPWVGG